MLEPAAIQRWVAFPELPPARPGEVRGVWNRKRHVALVPDHEDHVNKDRLEFPGGPFLSWTILSETYRSRPSTPEFMLPAWADMARADCCRMESRMFLETSLA